jgi:hypothetical protein
VTSTSFAPLDWFQLAEQPRPQPGRVDASAVDRAAARLAAYQPGFFARLFRLERRQRARLARALAAAKANAVIARRRAALLHGEALADWHALRQLAHAVLAGNRDAYRMVVGESDCLHALASVSSAVVVHFTSKDIGHLRIRCNAEHPDPDLLRRCAVHAARHILAVLPVRGVFVRAVVSNAENHDDLVLSGYCPRPLDRAHRQALYDIERDDGSAAPDDTLLN